MIGALKRLLGLGKTGAGQGEGRPVPAAAPAAEKPAAPADAERQRSLLAAGVAQFQAGDFQGAAQSFEQCVEIAHDDAEALVNLGVARKRLGQREDAADAFAMALHFHPDHAEAHFNLGVLDLERGDNASAAKLFEEAARLKPGYADALSNLGLIQFKHFNRFDEAEATLQRALAARKRFPAALCNLGMLRHDQGRDEEAMRLYDEALRQDPATHEARLNRALLHLAQGRFARGWEEYEARKRGSAHFVRRYERYPEWDGAPAPERTLLVYGEQGLGDEIMFASCLPEAIASVRHCVIDCSPKLEAIFRRSFPSATVHGGPQNEADVSWLSRGPAIDMQIAIGSLPRFFRASAAVFPRHAGYLKADDGKIARWRKRLDGLGDGLKVGISWRGGAAATRRETRSIALEQLLPVLRQRGIHFVSLQYTDCADEIARLRAAHGVGLEHWQDAIADYDETAALVSALDLVISVQTAIVHLGGALGRPVWVMVPAVPEWRYLRQGEGVPWYPSVRLVRQASPGDWQAVIDAVARRVAMQPEAGGPP